MLRKILTGSGIFALLLSSTSIILAQSAISGNTAGFDNLDKLIKSFANGVVLSTGYMMFTLAVVAFFFGIVQFIWSARQGAEGKGIQKGTQFMKWGLIAIFVMFSLWGIVKFAQGVFGIQGDNTIIVPSLSFQQSGASGASGANGNSGASGLNTNVTGGLAAGVACVNTSQCASGLTCVGGNASNRVCTAASGGTASSIQTCINNGSDRVVCECEARGGAWNLTDNRCFVSGGGNGSSNNSAATFVDCSSNSHIGKDCKFINNVGVEDKGTCQWQNRPDLGVGVKEITCRVKI